MKTLKLMVVLLVSAITLPNPLQAQEVESKKNQNITKMNTYLIERDIPGAGEWTPQQLKEISQASCQVISELGPGIKWVHSYVANDKVFCIYQAQNEATILEHAQKGSFPLNAVHLLSTKISPETAQE